MGWQQPPRQPKRSKAPWFVGGGIGLIAIAVVVVVLIVTNSATPSQQSDAAGPSSSTRTTTAAPKPVPGAPLPCPGNEKFYCVPGITDVTKQVQPGMQAAGYTCGPAGSSSDSSDDSANLFCENPTGATASRQTKVTFESADNKPTNTTLGQIAVYGMADEWNSSTDLGPDAFALERQGFDATVAILLPQGTKVRQDLDAWLTANATACSNSKATSVDGPTAHVDGYIITCQYPTPLSISGDKGTASNYEGAINLDVNPYAFLDTDTNQPGGG